MKVWHAASTGGGEADRDGNRLAGLFHPVVRRIGRDRVATRLVLKAAKAAGQPGSARVGTR